MPTALALRASTRRSLAGPTLAGAALSKAGGATRAQSLAGLASADPMSALRSSLGQSAGRCPA